jgi:nucleoside 2-deoxyribosyltransferase
MTQPLALLRKYRCIYLASPYSRYREGPEAAWVEASRLGGELVAEGVKVFSPIAHSHSLCENNSDLDPMDIDLWMEQDDFFLDVCDALVVAMFDGWDSSHGIEQEIRYFRANKKPIHYLDPVDLELS